MDDDRLASELERRASAASPRPDWAQRDLLPAVWREIDARSQPMLASRWSPLAGVATLVAALLVLVVAVPRLVPQPPSATSSPTDTAVPSAEPSSAPGPLTVTEFAAQRASGALDGKTVMVDGRLVGENRRGPVCPLSQDDLCFVGTLEGTNIDVSARPLATMEGEGAIRLQVGPSPWPWWNHNWASTENQILVLRIDPSKPVEYIGSARTPPDGLAWSIAGASSLDFSALNLDDVVLIHGWLTGFGQQIPCPYPPPNDIAEGLPLRLCPYSAWLADHPAQPAWFGESGVGLQVQAGAYYDFAPDASAPGVQPVEPRVGTYAVARRLEGYCGSADPPCWEWTVVARVDAAPQVAPTQSPQAQAIECARIASAEPRNVTVYDETGLVEACRPSGGTSDSPAGASVSNPNGDLTILQIDWPGQIGCQSTASFTLSRTAQTYRLSGEITSFEACRLAPVVHSIRLSMRADVPASTVEVGEMVQRTEPNPTPTPSPPVQSTEVRTIDCPDETTGAGPVRIEDHTASVIECTAGGADVPIEDKVTPGTDSALLVTWIAPCAVDPLNTRIELWYREPKGDPSDPSRFQPPYLLVVNRTHSTESYACLDAISGRQARIQFEQPISSTDVELFFTSDGNGIDSVDAGNGANGFQLKIAADKPDYTEGEPINVAGTLTSELDATVTGLVGPMFGLEQLDGVIRFDPGPFLLMCPGSTDLTGGIPRERTMQWPSDWSAVDPNASFYDAYLREGELVLPAGTYRFYALSSFSVGPTCTNDPVRLEASIVVTVR